MIDAKKILLAPDKDLGTVRCLVSHNAGPTHTREFDCVVQVDLYAIARRLALKAATNKNRRATALGGVVVVQHIHESLRAKERPDPIPGFVEPASKGAD